ncbi:MAG: glycine dehydrogenase subunit 1 [Gallionellaceae bacterium]|nr:MAG: glycine dehydrogenase subunit 1 [Gallionellaceae bacterium]
MPFIPHTEPDIRAMLASIGARGVENLFDEIPAALKAGKLAAVPDGMNEMQVARLMNERAAQDTAPLNFIGAGAYEHHIPAAVWQIVSRGEFYTAYTPYQAEASQGTLQVLYEFQTMMASLTGMDVSNASLYDGASGLAEAVLMAVRSHKTSRKVLIPATVSPSYRSAVQSIVKLQGIELEEIPFCTESGNTVAASLDSHLSKGDVAALIIPQPNFFGVLEDVDALTDKAHAHGALAIALVNPLALALLKAPGQWGTRPHPNPLDEPTSHSTRLQTSAAKSLVIPQAGEGANVSLRDSKIYGADIAVGEGQPLGIPLSNGGPYFGFMCCKQALVRQMPGRIVGRTVDLDGKQGYTLTLQAREQHIRRAKATSNICSNQGLMATAATIHMALLGSDGLRRTAAASHASTAALVALAENLPGVKRIFSGPYFHEAVLQLPESPARVLDKMLAQGVLGGLDLSGHYPQLGNAVLVCATETKTTTDLQRYVDALKLSLTNQENQK